MHLAVKFGYDGSAFHGSQRQPDVRTVEGDVIEALVSNHAIDDPGTARFQCASRTDRYVSALGNVVAFDTTMPAADVLGILNAKLEDAWFHGYAEVQDDFNPRHAKSRWYRYLLPAEGLDPELLESAAMSFVGLHDFRNFCKRDERETVREVSSISVRRFEDDIWLLDFHAPGFLWNMVRRMVSAVRGVASGELSLDALQSALDSDELADLGVSTPEPLTLMDVSYDIPFQREPAVTSRLSSKIDCITADLRLKQAYFHFLDNYYIADERRIL